MTSRPPRSTAGAPKRRPPLAFPQRLLDRIDRPKLKSFDPFTPGDLHPFRVPEIAADQASVNSSAIGGPSSSTGFVSSWAYGQYEMSAYLEGQVFLGYPTLALMSQRAEYQNMVKTIADDMTRKWIRLKASAGVDKSAKIKRIEDKLEALRTRDFFKQAIMNDGYYGRGHVYIDTGCGDDKDELASNLGFGSRSIASAFKMPGQKILNLQPIEPVWCYPREYNTSNPLRPDWYVPQQWNVVTELVHRSRLLTLISSPVSDMLKPAYSFGGIPIIQKAKPYIDNWLQMRQNVQDYAQSLSMYVLATNMEALLAGNQNDAGIIARADAFNRFRRAKGVMLLDKDTEELRLPE